MESNSTRVGTVEKKVSFYIAQYPVHRTAQSAFTHYFPGRPVQSNTISTSLGSIQPHATINVRKALSIARYSFIQLSELEQCRVKKLAQGFNTAAQDSNPGSLSRDSGGLPLSHCTLLPYCTRYERLIQQANFVVTCQSLFNFISSVHGCEYCS